MGLCPPKDANTGDCDRSNLGNAWRALDAAGKPGKNVINRMVGKKISTNISSCHDTQYACNDGNTVYVNTSGKPGAIAVALGHEAAHMALPSPAPNVISIANNEFAAWDGTRPVYDALLGVPTYGQQAKDAFGPVMAGLANRGIRENMWIDYVLKLTGGRP